MVRQDDVNNMAWAERTLERAVWWLERMNDHAASPTAVSCSLEYQGYSDMVQWYEHWMYGGPVPPVRDTEHTSDSTYLLAAFRP